jgi:hypothetical protein
MPFTILGRAFLQEVSEKAGPQSTGKSFGARCGGKTNRISTGTSLLHADSIDAYEKAHPATAKMYGSVDVKYY